jgi:DNA-binding CsgD family transcriptional regulator
VDELFRRHEVIAEEAIERVDDSSMIRVVLLTGEAVDCFAVFVEPVNGRNALERAVRRFGISKREADVLELLVNGLTTGQIAARLCITDATVGDHIKSLFRKTKANKRSELVSRVFVQHQDLAPSWKPENQQKGK